MKANIGYYLLSPTIFLFLFFPGIMVVSFNDIVSHYHRCNLLEEVKDDKVDGTLLNLTLHPFEIASFIVNL